MKAITLWQPWASLIALGQKQYETRSWGTAYRGPIAIHAGKTYKRYASLWHETMEQFDLSELPTGVVVAVANLETVIRMDRNLAARQSDKELAHGQWEEGRWAWLLMDVMKLNEPVAARGMLGLWEWKPRVTNSNDLIRVGESMLQSE